MIDFVKIQDCHQDDYIFNLGKWRKILNVVSITKAGVILTLEGVAERGFEYDSLVAKSACITQEYVILKKGNNTLYSDGRVT